MTKFTNIAYIRMGLSLLLYATITLKTEKRWHALQQCFTIVVVPMYQNDYLVGLKFPCLQVFMSYRTRYYPFREGKATWVVSR
jgi:hypothetical protein